MVLGSPGGSPRLLEGIPSQNYFHHSTETSPALPVLTTALEVQPQGKLQAGLTLRKTAAMINSSFNMKIGIVETCIHHEFTASK